MHVSNHETIANVISTNYFKLKQTNINSSALKTNTTQLIPMNLWVLYTLKVNSSSDFYYNNRLSILTTFAYANVKPISK